MIFRRAVVAELASSGSAVFTVLFSIVFSVGLVRILGDAAGGKVDSQAIIALVALTALTWLPLLIALTLFIAVLTALSRAFRDSEMVVWFASGQSLLAWIRPVLRFVLPGVVLVGLLSIVVTPWADRQIAESKDRFAKRDDISKVTAGRFIESGAADRVVFVESVDVEGASVRNVFVSHRSQGREGVIVAREGVIEVTPDGDRFLVLQQGRRYEGAPGVAEYRMVEFERYAIRIESRPDAPLQEIAARAKPTGQLLSERNRWHDAELIWRFGMPALALLLSILAIPLAYTNPRLGRSTNLIIAVLAFFLYLTAVQLSQGLVQTGRWVAGAAGPLPHVVVLVLMVLLFARRVYWQRWLPGWLMPWRRAAAARAREPA